MRLLSPALAALLLVLPVATASGLLGPGPVLGTPHVVLVFWGFHTTGVAAVDDPAGEEPFLAALFAWLGGNPWLDTLAQYGVGNPATLLQPPFDVLHHDPPGGLPAIVPDTLLASEAVAAADQYWGLHGYNANDQFIVATPHLRSTAEFGVAYCAYHAWVQDGAGRLVPYVNLPYQTDMPLTCGASFPGGGPLDAVSLAAAGEFANTATDPFGSGWQDITGKEVASKCAGQAGDPHLPRPYALPALWSNAAGRCV
ncbi:MAG: hypothetical protein QOI63_316 [Thermoplasmata archaeon]|jgi:hypothetical protein|nr:hypothetical protein [Thermoplasmata archaeon]